MTSSSTLHHPGHVHSGGIVALVVLCQLEALDSKSHALLRWLLFDREKCIFKTMMFRDVTTILNERTHLKMVTRSVPDSVSLILG